MLGRGFGSGIARLPAVAALLAGAALIAGAKARAQSMGAAGEETAMAVPRLAASGEAELALPQPLGAGTAARLRRIFAFQAVGDIAGAQRASTWFDDASPLGVAMLGHVLADRYLRPETRPDPAALRDWLARWPELPDAPVLHRLLVIRLPAGEAVPPAPPGFAAIPEAAPAPALPPDANEPAGPPLTRNAALDQDVREAARRGAAAVERLLGRARGLSPDYLAQLRAEAAQTLFTLNRDAEALALAAGGLHGCGGGSHAPCTRTALTGLVGGLAAWRRDEPALAEAMFEAGWRAERTTPAWRAASAFWAARARLQQGDRAGYRAWMLRAAEQPHSFYGMIARRRLGLPLLPRLGPGERELLGEADIAAVAATGPGLRAFALLQVGRPERAAAELRLLWPAAQRSRDLARAVMLVADAAALPDVAAAYADRLAAADGRPREALRFALPRLRPSGGFRMDPAMLYAIVRAESNFDPDCVSSAGAQGLLQIMPETAADLLGRRAGGEALLHDPGFNLDLGQRYIAYLAEQEPVHGDLLRLLASYNAGPGGLGRWAGQIRDDDDPLLFLEAIPNDETRAYVPQVLAYTWIYAARLHLPAPSLDELAAGQWPRYHAPTAPLSLARLQ
jgi:soluble lytic murein transglycosylase-like protein